MARKILSGVSVALLCALIWLFIQKRTQPPLPPKAPMPYEVQPKRAG